MRLWEKDAAEWRQRTVLEGHIGKVYSLAFSPYGRTLVSGAGDPALGFWDVRTGKLLAKVPTH